ncbi:MAG: DUF222 domain-containing protein, partial [Nocardioides sp.]
MSTRSEAPITAMNAAFDHLAEVDPTYQTVDERKARLTATSRLIARLEADRIHVLSVSDDIAIETSARSTAHWLADETRDDPGQIRARERVANSLGTQVSAALSQGSLNFAQARVIVEALNRLPDDRDPELRVKGEAYLVAEAAHFGPRPLRLLGAKLLQVIAPGPGRHRGVPSTARRGTAGQCR